MPINKQPTLPREVAEFIVEKTASYYDYDFMCLDKAILEIAIPSTQANQVSLSWTTMGLLFNTAVSAGRAALKINKNWTPNATLATMVVAPYVFRLLPVCFVRAIQ